MRKEERRRGRICHPILWSLIALEMTICGVSCPKNKVGNEVEKEEMVFGSYARVKIGGGDKEMMRRAIDSIFTMFHRFERLWSSFSESSEVSLLNQTRSLVVSVETRDLITRALEFGKKSEGTFDITIGPLMRLWGFRGGEVRVPKESEIRDAKTHIGYQRVKVVGDTVFLEKGMEIDLGGIAVGYAVDRAVDLLKSMGSAYGMVDCGGDIRVFGNRPWRIGIQNPRGEGVDQVLILTEEAIATSGDYQRFFEINGKRFSHIVDPRSGYPAQGCIAVTVKAKTALEADVYSTALFVMGPEDGVKWLERHPDVSAIFYVLSGDSLVKIMK